MQLNRRDDASNTGSPPSPPLKSSKRPSTAASTKAKRTPAKNKAGTCTDNSVGLPPLNSYDTCELSNTFFDNSNKVKVEIIPQVDNDMYSSGTAIYGNVKNNVVEMWESPPAEDSSSSFRTIKSIEDARAGVISENSASKSPEYATSVIRHSSDDFGNSTSSYDKYISVHVKEEVCKDGNGVEEYDSEDTKSAASLTFREEDEDKLIIDEETMEVKQFVNVHPNETIVGDEVRTS